MPAPIADDTFGATTRALLDLAGQYHQCRAAARSCAGLPPTGAD